MHPTPLTFSELIKHSFTTTKTLFKTYFLGVLLLMAVMIVSRIFGAIFVKIGMVHGFASPLIILAILGLLCFFVNLVAQVLMQPFALVLAVERTHGVIALLKKTLSLILPLILLGLWLFLCSWAWITFIGVLIFLGAGGKMGFVAAVGILVILAGVVCGIVRLPRFAFAYILLIKGHKKIKENARQSFEATRGYWGKIVGNSLLLGLIVMATFIVLMIPAGLLIPVLRNGSWLSSDSIANGVLIVIIISVFGLFFLFCMLLSRVFAVELFDTIKKHPIVK